MSAARRRAARPVRRHVHAPLQGFEARAPGSVERDDLPVEDRRPRAQRGAELPELRIPAVMSRSLRDMIRIRPPSTYDTARTPSHLNSKAHSSSSEGRSPAVASMGRTSAGSDSHPAGAGSILWIIHWSPLVQKNAKRPVDLLAVEVHFHLPIGPLELVVGAAVPDAHRPGAVLALRDLPLEAAVLERVVLDVDGEMVLPLVQRQALGNGPRHEDAVALQAEVPVQRPGVVLLDHERGWPAPRSARPRRASGTGSGVRSGCRLDR